MEDEKYLLENSTTIKIKYETGTPRKEKQSFEEHKTLLMLVLVQS